MQKVHYVVPDTVRNVVDDTEHDALHDVVYQCNDAVHGIAGSQSNTIFSI
jgi:hypothetical protein